MSINTSYSNFTKCIQYFVYQTRVTKYSNYLIIEVIQSKSIQLFGSGLSLVQADQRIGVRGRLHLVRLRAGAVAVHLFGVVDMIQLAVLLDLRVDLTDVGDLERNERTV